VLTAAIFTLTNVVVALHIVVSLALVVLVLLHSGRGGGVSEMFGGVQSAAAGSTVVERNLDRITVAAAVVFAFTTIMLAIRLQ
jgi:preprotein translocase subunit SecG